jgi:carbon storage regulator CsrA
MKGKGTLVLHRKRGQSITINQDIEVIVGIKERGGIYLTIQAPKDINIVRTELLEKHRYFSSEQIQKIAMDNLGASGFSKHLQIQHD